MTEVDAAKNTLAAVGDRYPILITRDLRKPTLGTRQGTR